MSDLYELYVAVAVLAAALTGMTIWSRHRLGLKISAILVAMLFLPLSYAALAELLSRPKPVSLEWWRGQAEEADVLAGNIVEDKAIHLWLKLESNLEPRAYSLPWSRDLAENLQEALREADENNSGVRMRLPFEPSWDDQADRFYALPQPALPPKDVTDPPQRYEQPSTSA